jgi:WD40 repeat protein
MVGLRPRTELAAGDSEGLPMTRRLAVLLRRRLALLLALALAACGGPPETAPAGERIEARLARGFADAPAPARQLRFSPDGGLLATTSVSGAVSLRRFPDLRLVRRVTHPGGATSLAFSPDGAWLVTGGYDGAARLWAVASGRELRSLDGASGTIWTVDVSPDGRRIVTAGEDGALRLWHAADGRLLAALRGHARNIWEARFSPDGSRIASGSFDRSLILWDAARGRPRHRLADHGQAVVGLAWSRDGGWLATGGDDSTIRLRRAADGAPLRVIAAGNHVYKLAFSPDSRWLASAGRARGGLGSLWHQLTGLGGRAWPVRIWRAGDGALVAALPAADDAVSVAFSPDGRWLAAAGEESPNRLWRQSSTGDA